MPYIDPQVKPIIENMKKFREERGSISNICAEDMRKNFNNDIVSWNVNSPDIKKVSDFHITTSSRDIPVRLYDPSPEKELLPTLIFIHGGGWIVGDLDSNENCLRRLSIRSGLRILSIDYPLAPENPFPIALNCLVETIEIIKNKGNQWGIDTNNLAIGGDSAGANLALCTAIDLKNKNLNFLKQITLIYGALSPLANTASFVEFGQGEYGMGIEAMEFFWKQYLQQPENYSNPRAVPLLADLKALPPVEIISAGLDPLQDDSHLLAEKLRDADVKYTLSHYPGVIHGFFSLCSIIDEGDKAISHLAASLKNFFKIDKE